VKIKVNDQLTDAEVFQLINGDPVKKKISEIIKNKKVVMFGLPGAYTSVCSAKHLPGYIKNVDQFKSKGIDQIICISVNDPFVMDAWGKANNVGNNILMLADPLINFTKAIGAEVDKSGRGLGIRSNRYTMLIDNLKVLNIKEELNTGTCEISAAENFLKLV
jgi:peroxiredoxin (alkyl hydroperoxide reductase subunit C)